MDIENLHPRVCDITNKGMSEGFVMDDIYIENEEDLIIKLREGIPYFNADINRGMSEYNGDDALGGGLIPKTISDEDLKEFAYDNEYCNEYQYEGNKWLKIEKPNFRIHAKVVTYCYLDVVANSEDEAIEIFNKADGGDFITQDGGDWDLNEVERLD